MTICYAKARKKLAQLMTPPIRGDMGGMDGFVFHLNRGTTAKLFHGSYDVSKRKCQHESLMYSLAKQSKISVPQTFFILPPLEAEYRID